MDKLRDDRGSAVLTQGEIAAYLFENLRLDHSRFLTMDAEFLGRLGEKFRSRKVVLCARLLQSMRSRHNLQEG